MSDRLFASPLDTQHSQETDMPPERFEPEVPTNDRQQTLALNRSAETQIKTIILLLF